MDNSNGIRNASSNAYNKVRARMHPVYFVTAFISLAANHMSPWLCVVACRVLSSHWRCISRGLLLFFRFFSFIFCSIIWDQGWFGFCSRSTDVPH